MFTVQYLDVTSCKFKVDEKCIIIIIIIIIIIREDLVEGWRRLHNERLHKLHVGLLSLGG
jgi:hypothetical protein